MKKFCVLLLIFIIISLFFTSVVYSQEEDNSDDESDIFNWAFQIDVGLDFSLVNFIKFNDPYDPEYPDDNYSGELWPGDSEMSISFTIYTYLKDGHGFGFQLQIPPLFDIYYHLYYIKEFYILDFIIPHVTGTIGFNIVNGYPGFGFKAGGGVSFVPNLDFIRLGFQLMFSWGYGRAMGSPAYEGQYIMLMPFTLYIKYLF